MGKSWGAPGSCADCGDDAYIRMRAGKDGHDMVCAHCYGKRIRINDRPPVKVQTSRRLSGIRST